MTDQNEETKYLSHLISF